MSAPLVRILAISALVAIAGVGAACEGESKSRTAYEAINRAHVAAWKLARRHGLDTTVETGRFLEDLLALQGETIHAIMDATHTWVEFYRWRAFVPHLAAELHNTTLDLENGLMICRELAETTVAWFETAPGSAERDILSERILVTLPPAILAAMESARATAYVVQRDFCH